MIASANLYRYSIPLRRPLPVADMSIGSRAGLLVRFCDDAHRSGWGEAAPLPGLSVETIEEAGQALENLLPQLIGRSTPNAAQLRDPKFLTRELGTVLPASVSFALETAFWSLAAQQEHTSIARSMNPDARDLVRRNCLIPPGEKPLEETARARLAGFDTLKLKVGRQRLEEDVRMVKEIREFVGADVMLRLDANRRWTWHEAMTFARGVQDCGIEYIEEPLDDPAGLPRFAAESGLPVALDESLRDGLLPGIPFAGLRAVILHPTLQGGLSSCLRQAETLRTNEVLAVISSAFETGVGLTALAHLAAALPLETAAGLDTGHWFTRSLVSAALFDDDPTSPIRLPWVDDELIDTGLIQQVV